MGEDQKMLYIGNLPPDITEDELRDVFQLYGVVVDVFVNKSTGAQLGDQHRSAFVGFEVEHNATAAMLVLTEMYKFRESMTPILVKVARPHCEDGRGAVEIGSNGLAVSTDLHVDHGDPPAPPPPAPPAPAPPAPPAAPAPLDIYQLSGAPPAGSISYASAPRLSHDCKLWVGSLPGDTTQDVLQKVFGAYGTVVEINLMPIKARSGQACAFIHFSRKDEADACVESMRVGYEVRPGTGAIVVERPGDRRKGMAKGYVKGAPLPPPSVGMGPSAPVGAPIRPAMGAPPAPPMAPPMGGPSMDYRYQPY